MIVQVNETDDKAILDAAYFFQSGTAVPVVLDGVGQREEFPSGVRIRIFRETLFLDGGLSSQDVFDAAMLDCLGRVESIGLSRPMLKQSSGDLRLSIALVPRTGTAGLYLDGEMLARWSQLGADLLLNAWPGAPWAYVETDTDEK